MAGGGVGDVGVQTSDERELALSGLTRRPQQLIRFVDLSALREMYSATVTLSIDYSQEVCKTENKVGPMRMTRSGIEKKLAINLSFVGHWEGVNFRRKRPQTPPGTMDAGARQLQHLDAR
jgi:hypothetical protein